MRSFFFIAVRPALLSICLALFVGCTSSSGPLSSVPQIEMAFSPDAGSEAFVLKVIDSARSSIRLARYSFTSPTIVRTLINAKRRGVDLRVLIDEKGNRGGANITAMNLLVGADIPIRAVSKYAIHHDKYIVFDGKHTQTGSFNYTQAAARSKSENVLVVWRDPTAGRSLPRALDSRWAQGLATEMTY